MHTEEIKKSSSNRYYRTPKAEIIHFSYEDVIATSGCAFVHCTGFGTNQQNNNVSDVFVNGNIDHLM